MATRLYFHNATFDTGTYPGSYPANNRADDGTGTDPKVQGGFSPRNYGFTGTDATSVHRSMNKTKGSSQSSKSCTSATSLSRTYYWTKFISEPLSGVSTINANIWRTHKAYAVNSLSSSTMSMNLSLYVWRPSSGGSNIGFVYSYNVFSGSVEPSATGGQRLFAGDMSAAGSQVTGIANGDVLICEIWLRQTTTSQVVTTFYYDGPTEYNDGVNLSGANTIASYIETPQDLTFVTDVPTTVNATSDYKDVLRQRPQQLITNSI